MQRGYAVANAYKAMAFDSQTRKQAKSRDRTYRLKKLREKPIEVIVNELMKILEVGK